MAKYAAPCLLVALAVSASLPSSAQPTVSQPIATVQPAPVANVVVPPGWLVERLGAARVLTAPEAGSLLAVVETRQTEADAAVAEAWSAIGRPEAWPVKFAVDRPAQAGWQAIRVYEYALGVNDLRSVQARAFRHGPHWTVVLVDVSRAVSEKRAAQINAVFDQLTPPGYRAESLAGRVAHRLDATRIEALVSFVREAQRELEIPGVSIGLVQGGRVVHMGGYGVRELGRDEPVGPDTLYMIASNTKPLTTLMLARLVDRKKFDWTTPAVALMPSFALGDAATTRRVQVQHLLCACTGLPRRDLEWIFEFDGIDPAGALATLRGMQPTSDFGSLFQYSNQLAAAGGYVGAHVLYPGMEVGAAYDRAMSEHVLGPLGMRATTFDMQRALAAEHASPHAKDADARTVVASMTFNQAIVPVRPAGGAWSNVRDLLRYVQMELDRGRLPDGSRYVSEAALAARAEPKVARGAGWGYGMGLGIDARSGIRVVNHGGSLLGYKSDMMWLPEHGVGAVLLANSDSARQLLEPFQRRLLEVLFDAPPLAAEQLRAAAARSRALNEAERRRLTIPAAASVADKLAARYRNPSLGTILVRRDGARTMVDLGEWDAEVGSRVDEKGQESLRLLRPGVLVFEFAVGRNERGRTLVLRDNQHEYVFEEVL